HFGESDADEDGFFVDTDKPDTQISVDQLAELEQSMHNIIKQDLSTKVVFLSADEAAQVAGDDPYQQELVKENEVDGKVKFFQIGDFKSIA
ncbi:threonine--tRNA ligase, partial [Lactobacillus parabuchneri]|nr:threonine--tRNA ligase [Lentilactobacillus parabuchneri]